AKSLDGSPVRGFESPPLRHENIEDIGQNGIFFFYAYSQNFMNNEKVFANLFHMKNREGRFHQ
ncbi:MAG: hypothetical protein E6161_07635, partial [Dialister sp.]|nr:hypothetical protein [Dialister sp.]